MNCGLCLVDSSNCEEENKIKVAFQGRCRENEKRAIFVKKKHTKPMGSPSLRTNQIVSDGIPAQYKKGANKIFTLNIFKIST